MSVSLLEIIEVSGWKPLENIEDAEWLLAKQKEFEGLIEQVEDFLEEIDRINEEASEEEAMQERADELRHAMREDGEVV